MTRSQRVKPANGRRGPGRAARASAGPAARPAAARRSTPRRTKATTRSRRRRTRAPSRRSKLIRQNPGITVPDIADKLGIRPNYLYRVTAGLQKERTIRRRGGGFHAA